MDSDRAHVLLFKRRNNDLKFLIAFEIDGHGSDSIARHQGLDEVSPASINTSCFERPVLTELKYGDTGIDGTLGVDFAVGVDLSDLSDGITFDDLFIELDALDFAGTISTEDLSLALGFGPIVGKVNDGSFRLSAGVELDLLDGEPLSLTELRDLGFSAVDATLLFSTASGNLPLELDVNGLDVADTDHRPRFCFTVAPPNASRINQNIDVPERLNSRCNGLLVSFLRR